MSLTKIANASFFVPGNGGPTMATPGFGQMPEQSLGVDFGAKPTTPGF